MPELRKNILIFTGDGKGKSTAAFGMALRAVGHQQRVLVLQFMKQDDSIGELAGLKQLGIEVIQTGCGFVPKPEHPDYASHQQSAQQGFVLACEALASSKYDLVVFDEICGAVAKGLLEEAEVVDALLNAPAQNIVLTGRGATEGLIALADTVSEINCCKHALANGVAARKGVEF
ncbi:MAG: cob(I)yrinic acid a,c-diamide adenosyltransferase [Desulfuromonadales bacterium]|nr:cob(I)yrinic acid a,c-diamide adenosyltransferase [Desulfuromonadales bacterium]